VLSVLSSLSVVSVLSVLPVVSALFVLSVLPVVSALFVLSVLSMLSVWPRWSLPTARAAAGAQGGPQLEMVETLLSRESTAEIGAAVADQVRPEQLARSRGGRGSCSLPAVSAQRGHAADCVSHRRVHAIDWFCGTSIARPWFCLDLERPAR
jgi:hypothetical protein